AGSEIAVPADGAWTPQLAAEQARRVLTRLGRHIVNLERATIKTAVLSPADLERYNVNLVGGDPYSGACTLGQFHLWRPFPGGRNHRRVRPSPFPHRRPDPPRRGAGGHVRLPSRPGHPVFWPPISTAT